MTFLANFPHPFTIFRGGFFGFFRFFLFMYDIQHCFICRPSDSAVSEDAGIEPQDTLHYFSLWLTTQYAVGQVRHRGVIERQVLYLNKRQNHFMRENKKEDRDAERTEGLSYYNVYAHLLQTNLLAVCTVYNCTCPCRRYKYT